MADILGIDKHKDPREEARLIEARLDKLSKIEEAVKR